MMRVAVITHHSHVAYCYYRTSETWVEVAASQHKSVLAAKAILSETISEMAALREDRDRLQAAAARTEALEAEMEVLRHQAAQKDLQMKALEEER